MGRITKWSQIETFRIERHGRGSTLRFLTDDKQDAEGYEVLAVLTSHFYISKSRLDTSIGEYRAKLAFNRPEGFTVADLQRTMFIDLIQTSGTMRYSRATETPPTTIEDRWYLMLSAAFNDLTPIKPLEP